MSVYYKIKDDKHTYQIVHSGTAYSILNDKGDDCITLYARQVGEELYLSRIKYDEKCSLHSLLKRGSETVRMIKAFLSFILNRIQFSKITLIDESTFECKLESLDSNLSNDMEYGLNDVNYKIPIPLAFQNITLYGKTWYERHLGATIADSYAQQQINESVKKLSSLVENGIAIERFNIKIENTMNRTSSTEYKQALQYALTQIYASIGKTSWMKCFQDLFGTSGSVYKNYGEAIACSLYYELDSVINDIMKLPHACNDLFMEISKETIQTYPSIEDLGINTNPTYVQKVGGSKFKRLHPSVPLAHYYTRRSLKRKSMH